MFMTDLKQELVQRFHESACYQQKRGRKEIARYTDKYRKVWKEPFEPDLSRVPAELNWAPAPGTATAVKRRRLDDALVQKRLAHLEERERHVNDQVSGEVIKKTTECRELTRVGRVLLAVSDFEIQ